MTDFITPYDVICADLNARAPAEGALLGVFVGQAGKILLTMEIGEGTSDVDEMFLQHLVAIVADLRVSGVVFAVVRSDGRPTRVDKRLWQELNARLVGAATSLIDVIVVGESRWWSAASGRSTQLVTAA